MNQYPSLWERDESGEMADRDVQTVVEEGGVPSFADATDEEGEAVAPPEDTGANVPTQPTTPTTPADTGAGSGSSSWLIWLIILVIGVAGAWYFSTHKGSKPEAKPSKKEEP